jgi:hypothetical protein
MPSDSKSRRREPRTSNSASVQFRLDSHPSNEIILALTSGMDDSGISIYTKYSLTEGQVIILEGKPEKPDQRATVIWVKNYGHFFKVRLKPESALFGHFAGL